MLFAKKQTLWEKLEGIKSKKLQARAALFDELGTISQNLKALLIDEKDTASLLKEKQTIEDRIKNLEEEIKILEEEQSKTEKEHLQNKVLELDDKIAQINKDLEPHKAAYEKAKAEFAKAETEWFSLLHKARGKMDDVDREKAKIKPRLDTLSD